MMRRRILIVTLPSQGHINPSLQLAKLLIRAAGAHVTFVTSVSAGTRMSKSPNLAGLDFATFSDGYDDGCKDGDDADRCMSQIERLGSQALTELVIASINEGRPFACLLYGVQIPWAAEVARRFRIPAALVWTQPATVFDIYYYYFNGYEEVINDPSSSSIELPGLPLLNSGDLPSFLAPKERNIYKFALPGFQKHVEMLNSESNPKVLVNSFDALESDALGAVNKFNLMGIGPLIPSAFLDGKDPSDTSFGGDLFRGSNEYIQWLNSKPESSVIYVSFGSLSVLSKKQAEEIGRGLLDDGRPFLWVMRMEENVEENTLSCQEDLEEKGMIVPWCCQVDVLSHPSVGCFVTHSGWNSTIESLSFGVPVVSFPQWSDQPTNAKLIEDVWKTGVRVMVNDQGMVEAGEIKRCVELVMGSDEMRRNAKKWKGLAREAVKEGGSSDKNLKNFINEIIQQSF